jgi:hypothetical protein
LLGEMDDKTQQLTLVQANLRQISVLFKINLYSLGLADRPLGPLLDAVAHAAAVNRRGLEPLYPGCGVGSSRPCNDPGRVVVCSRFKGPTASESLVAPEDPAASAQGPDFSLYDRVERTFAPCSVAHCSSRPCWPRHLFLLWPTWHWPPSSLHGRHAVDKKLVGPSYQDVSKKYAGQKDAEAKLEAKVKKGGSGVWGPVPMLPNPTVSDADCRPWSRILSGAK